VVPRVLTIVDRPGWAVERKALNLRRHLAGRYDVVLRYQHEVVAADLDAVDLVVIFYWLQLRKVQFSTEDLARRSDRLLIGICSEFELEADRREPGLEVLRTLPRAVFANNARLARTYGGLIDRPMYETPNGVDTSFFTARRRRSRWRRRSGSLRVGWAGSLTNQGPDHRRVDAVLRPAVERVDGATFHGAIREERWRDAGEMRDFYRELDVYVCASVSEGTPNPCFEAAACGVPLVTTPVGALPELVRDGENGRFFDGTVDQLVDRLTELRDDPRGADRLAGRMLHDVRRWDWSVLAERYATMFADALQNAETRKART